RGFHGAVDRGYAPDAGCGPAAPESGAMSASTLAGLVGAALVGLGLYGLIVNPQPLRNILAFNLVPKAMVITGIVVALAASALAVALILRLREETGNVSLDSDAPAKPPGDGASAS